MRYVSVAIFLFIVQVSMALINSLGIFQTTLAPNSDWTSQIGIQNLQAQQYAPSQVNNQVDFGFGDVVKGIFFFVFALAAGVIVLPWTIVQFGVSWGLASIISVPFYLMYLLGLAQWIANRNERMMR